LEKENVSVETSGKLMEDTINTVKQYSAYFFIIGGMLLGFTFLSLISIFTLTLNERKKEYGIVRSLGGSSSQILFLTIGEAAAIGLIGSTAGSFLAVLLLTLFRNLIILHLKLPYFRQSILGMLLLSGFCLILSVFTGVAASLFSTLLIRKKEAYTLIKENE
jgi:putative ABC transport system permease protein